MVGWLGVGGRVCGYRWPLEPVLHIFDVKHQPFHKQITEYTHLKLRYLKEFNDVQEVGSYLCFERV